MHKTKKIGYDAGLNRTTKGIYFKVTYGDTVILDETGELNYNDVIRAQEFFKKMGCKVEITDRDEEVIYIY